MRVRRFHANDDDASDVAGTAGHVVLCSTHAHAHEHIGISTRIKVDHSSGRAAPRAYPLSLGIANPQTSPTTSP